MRAVAMLAARLLSSGLSGVARTARRNAALAALAALFGLTAFLAFVLALGIWLATSMGAIGAALFVALIMLVLAATTIAVLMLLNRRDRRRRRAFEHEAVQAAALTGVVSLLPRLLRSKATLGVLAVAVTAFLLARGGGDGDAGEA